MSERMLASKRPRRRWFSFFLRWYDVIVATFVIALVLDTGHVSALGWSVLCTVLYLGYCAIRILLRNVNSVWFRFGRALMLTAGATAFLAVLHHQQPGVTDSTIWLLLVLPSFVLSVSCTTEFLGLTIAMSWLGLTIVSVAAVDESHPFSLPVLQYFWLAFLSFAVYVQTRFFRDWWASVEFLHDVARQINQLRLVRDEDTLLDTLVSAIARHFNYAHVNLFYIHRDKQLRCVAASSDAGKELVRTGYCLEPGRGILGHVVETEEPWLANSVDHDPYYHRHPAFPTTRSELAVPMTDEDSAMVGVIDIQSDYRNAFLPQDLSVMEIAARHLVRALDNVRLVISRSRLHRIMGQFATGMLSPAQLDDVLKAIADAAHEELKADPVLVFEYNPTTKQLHGPVKAGELKDEDAIVRDHLEPNSLVDALIHATDRHYLEENVPAAEAAGPLAGRLKRRETLVPPFHEREAVASRAIEVFRTEAGCVGMLFLNYRQPTSFSSYYEEALDTFGNLAALAIQNAQSRANAATNPTDTRLRNLLRRLPALTASAPLDDSLQEITETARAELRADSALIFVHNPATGEVHGPLVAGSLRRGDLIVPDRLDSGSLPDVILRGTALQYFDENVPLVEQTGSWSEHVSARRAGVPPFVEREEILSRAIQAFRTESGCLGLLFVNLRHPVTFSKEQKEALGALGSLASILIQSNQTRETGLRSKPDRVLAPKLEKVARLWVRCLDLKSIANQLSLSPETVHRYTNLIYQTWGVHSREDSIRVAERLGWPVDPVGASDKDTQ